MMRRMNALSASDTSPGLVQLKGDKASDGV
jgi:hypothetical protein